MAINSGAINTHAVNASATTSVFIQGEGLIIGFGQNVKLTTEGSLIAVEQNVIKRGQGSLIGFEQEVLLKLQGSGPIIGFEQNVVSRGEGSLVNFAQKVRQSTTKLDKYKYDVEVFLGGYKIPDSQLTEQMTISFEEDTASSTTLVLRPGPGVQNVADYFGKSLIITAAGANGVMYRVFTGIVDVADFDVLVGLTTLTATDRRKELLKDISNPLLKFGTPYNTSYLIDSDQSNEALIEEILPYADKSLDFDAYNNYRYTSWTPKTTPDILLGASTIYRRKPTIEQVTRGRIINRINITVSYAYTKLHYVQSAYTWNAPYDDNGANFDRVTVDGYSLTLKETIHGAISGCGWILKRATVFGELPPPGWYGGVLWLGDVKQYEAAVAKDESGNNVVDSNGRNVITHNAKETRTISGIHASSASFDLTKRFSQQAVKKYNLRLESTTSQAVFGVLDRESSYSFTDEYDSSRWESATAYESTFDVGNGNVVSLNSSMTIDTAFNESIAQSNIQATIDKARTEILSTHRENFVSCETQLLPKLQLYHTLEIDYERIEAKGKITAYTHVIDFMGPNSWTELTIAFYALGAGGTTSSRTLPTISIPNSASYPANGSLDSFYGVNPDESNNIKADGFFGNRWIPGHVIRTQYNEQFRVDSPTVSSGLTDGIEKAQSSTYTQQIPTSSLVIRYVDKCG